MDTALHRKARLNMFSHRRGNLINILAKLKRCESRVALAKLARATQLSNFEYNFKKEMNTAFVSIILSPFLLIYFQ